MGIPPPSGVSFNLDELVRNKELVSFVQHAQQSGNRNLAMEVSTKVLFQPWKIVYCCKCIVPASMLSRLSVASFTSVKFI